MTSRNLSAMPSVFISYAHEDQEFVLALIEQLEAQGLDVRYDQVVLHIGDSLIRAIAREIAEDDFVVAIVSPDSVGSEWCQTELALARTYGINERRVKVLPVRFRGAVMPAMLQDTFWGDADRFDVATLARRLTAAIQANVAGRDEAAVRAAADLVAEEAAAAPAHAEAAGDARVALVNEVADKVFDLLVQWDRCRAGAPIAELGDKQRRLLWGLDALPDEVRAALPLARHLAEADWNGYFNVATSSAAETDAREELRSVRNQVGQGLPIVRRWMIVSDFGQVPVENRDAIAFVWGLQRGHETRRITVYISGTAIESADEGLPREVVAAKKTNGRSVVAALVALDDLPREVMVTTAGISRSLPD